VSPDRELGDAPSVSAEAMAALELNLGGSLVLSAGAGTSLAFAVGSPDLRAFFAIGWGNAGDRLAASDDDGDGIVEGDACPDAAEDVDGVAPEDGCPDPGGGDADGDGILEGDVCPDEAEDKDGYQDEDGCPELDNDADGIPDAADKCPDAPEDKDGFQDEDGCPEPDNDGDGVPDASDSCPDRPEIVNGVDDQDGCPDTDDPEITITADAIVFQGRINFPTQSDRIIESSYGLLGRLAKLLREHSYLTRVRVEGYTDSQGWEHINLEVSQKRAAAVVKFLVDKGVAAERLVSEGYGEARPIAGNDTPGGRWKNRRIELRILTINGEPVVAPQPPAPSP
jgi:outer membrane protein OmpA-like peptidoglycan-associated protein